MSDKPIYRLVFRRLTGKPLINYVHAKDRHEANIIGFQLAEQTDYNLCYDETELINVQDVLIAYAGELAA